MKRIKERYGETYIGGKKIKNMGINQLRSIILNQVKDNLVSRKKINITSFYVKTDLFRFVIVLGNKNEIVTTLPKDNCYESMGSSLNYSLGGLEALRELKKAM